MLDSSTPRGRIIAALLKLAEERHYREIALVDVAREASLRLVELRNEFSSKADILAAFTRAVDDEVTRRMEFRLERAASPRDRLFDVIMTRFDVLLPYRPALRRILDALRTSPAEVSAWAFVASQAWMLAAAGVPTDGARGAARVTGLGALYARLMPIYLADDDPGLARTMAALDRRLRDGERVLGMVDGVCEGLKRILEPFAGRRGGGDAAPPTGAAGGGNGSAPEPRLF